MNATRRILAIPLIGAALTLIAFGVVRGVAVTGPSHGVRLIVAIAPPVDAAAAAMAEHVARERLDEKGMEVRVVQAGGELVIEIGEDDPQIATEIVRLLERTASLELHRVDAESAWLGKLTAFAAGDPRLLDAGLRVQAGTLLADDRWNDLAIAEADAIGCTGRVEDGKRHCLRRGDEQLATYVKEIAARDAALAVPSDRVVASGRLDGERTWRPYVLDRDALLDGRKIRHAQIIDNGVAIDVSDAAALAPVKLGVPLAFVLDGVVHGVAAPDRVAGTELHVPTPGVTQDAAIRTALDLVAVIEAGAVHPLHVVRQAPFVRATGFLPRAWPFLAAGIVVLLAAAVLWRRGGS